MPRTSTVAAKRYTFRGDTDSLGGREADTDTNIHIYIEAGSFMT